MVQQVSRPMMFRLIPEFMRGTQGNFKQVKLDKIKRMEIDCPQPLTLHTDGETYAGFASNVHHLKIEIVPNALEVMFPGSKSS
jgi:diacylglycerol kinase family enzyme